MTITTRSIHSTASPIGYTEFSTALLRAIEIARGIVPHVAGKVTLGLILLPVPKPDIEG